MNQSYCMVKHKLTFLHHLQSTGTLHGHTQDDVCLVYAIYYTFPVHNEKVYRTHVKTVYSSTDYIFPFLFVLYLVMLNKI
jgi:hypothetical protein